jgi:hypothetical protein
LLQNNGERIQGYKGTVLKGHSTADSLIYTLLIRHRFHTLGEDENQHTLLERQVPKGFFCCHHRRTFFGSR